MLFANANDNGEDEARTFLLETLPPSQVGCLSPFRIDEVYAMQGPETVTHPCHCFVFADPCP